MAHRGTWVIRTFWRGCEAEKLRTVHGPVLTRDAGLIRERITFDADGGVIDYQATWKGPHHEAASNFELFCDVMTDALALQSKSRIQIHVQEGRPTAALFVPLRRAQSGSETDETTRCECRRAGRRIVPSRPAAWARSFRPPPRSSAHANRPGPPVPSTPDAQVHVEFPPRVVVTQGPSEPNVHPPRPCASDDALRRSQRLDQVFNQGWVAYFNCHCRCRAPRVAAGEARTSHSRQKRSAVKAAADRTASSRT